MSFNINNINAIIFNLFLINLLTINKYNTNHDSITIMIRNTCSAILLLQCDGYKEVNLEPNQVFGFNFAPMTETVCKCKAKCKQKALKVVLFDVYGGKAPIENNEWETADDGIYLVKKVKYYLW